MAKKKAFTDLIVGSTVHYWPSPLSEEDEGIRSVVNEGSWIEATVSKIHFLYRDVGNKVLSASVNLTMNGVITLDTVTFAKQDGCSRTFTLPKDQ